VQDQAVLRGADVFATGVASNRAWGFWRFVRLQITHFCYYLDDVFTPKLLLPARKVGQHQKALTICTANVQIWPLFLAKGDTSHTFKVWWWGLVVMTSLVLGLKKTLKLNMIKSLLKSQPSWWIIGTTADYFLLPYRNGHWRHDKKAPWLQMLIKYARTHESKIAGQATQKGQKLTHRKHPRIKWQAGHAVRQGASNIRLALYSSLATVWKTIFF
jgi:hypothetical protein